MDEEVQKWSKKDPAAIRRSMAKPERLELLEKGFLKELYGTSGMFVKKIEKTNRCMSTINETS